MSQNILKKYWYNFLLAIILLFGIVLRLKGLLANPSMWHDECALAWNIKVKSYADYFGILNFGQMSAPFFLVITKFLTKILGFSDIILRLIPFVIGCLSILGFYFLCDKVLNKKSSVLVALLLFSINQQLINYSFEFKPYGLDVLFTILCLLFFINLNIEKTSTKRLLLKGFLLALIPWFSFVSVFIISAGLLNLFLKNYKSDLAKKICLIIPLFISGLIFLKIYFVNASLAPQMVNYWHTKFVTGNVLFSLQLLINSVRFLFFPVKFILFFLVLMVWGIIVFYKEKSSFFNISCLAFVLFIIASLLHFYPLFDRLVLFLIPIFLLWAVKPLDLISKDKKIKTFIIIFLLLTTFYPQIDSLKYFMQIKTFSRGEAPREMMAFMADKIKPEDIIFVNGASDAEFAYYSSFYNIKNKVIQEQIPNKTAQSYRQLLNNLKSGNYWLYLPYDSSELPVFSYIYDWTKSKQIIYYNKMDKGALLYVHVK